MKQRQIYKKERNEKQWRKWICMNVEKATLKMKMN